MFNFTENNDCCHVKQLNGVNHECTIEFIITEILDICSFKEQQYYTKK